MSKSPVNFAELMQRVTAPKVGKEKLSIWGGECAEAKLLSLVQHWTKEAEMPYRIWEYSDNINFEKNTVPDDVLWLERGRLFGSGGDLNLRRDGGRFLWYFVGKVGITPPTIGSPCNFWEVEPEAAFHQNGETALLWGERREGTDLWFDDRAAKANLIYPAEADWSRVQVYYWTFSRAGRVEFVWFYGLEAYNG